MTTVLQWDAPRFVARPWDKPQVQLAESRLAAFGTRHRESGRPFRLSCRRCLGSMQTT